MLDRPEEVEEVELEVDVDAVVLCASGEVPGIVMEVIKLRAPTVATEPKATPAVIRLSSRKAESRELTLFWSAELLGSMVGSLGAAAELKLGDGWEFAESQKVQSKKCPRRESNPRP